MADMLVTTEELGEWLQNPGIDTGTATRLITAATGVVQRATKQRLIAVQNDTITIEGTPEPWLVLPQRPVTAVHSILFEDNTLTPDEYKLVGNRLWRGYGWQFATVLWPAVRIPYWRYLTYPPPSLVTITYDHGYQQDDPDLELARTMVFALAAAAFANPGSLRSVAIDDYSRSFTDATLGMTLSDLQRKELRRAYGVTSGSVRQR